MTTILPLGTTVCIDCRTPVAVVRRKVAYWCSGHGRVCNSESRTTTIVEADGTRHLCSSGIAFERPFGYNVPDGSSVIESDTMCDGRTTARPSGAAVSRLEV